MDYLENTDIRRESERLTGTQQGRRGYCYIVKLPFGSPKIGIVIICGFQGIVFY